MSSIVSQSYLGAFVQKFVWCKVSDTPQMSLCGFMQKKRAKNFQLPREYFDCDDLKAVASCAQPGHGRVAFEVYSP